MDKASLRAAEFMSGQMPLRDLDTGQLLTPEGHSSDIPALVDTRVHFGYVYDDQGQRQANRLSMMELGFVPTFYQFVDTVIDMKLIVRLHRQSADSGVLPGTPTTDARAGGKAAGRSHPPKTRTVITTAPVDARYSSSYNFSAEMTSRVKTKLVPVPPPSILEERIGALLAQERLDRQRMAQESEERDKRALSGQPLGGPEFDGTFCYEVGDLGATAALVTNAFTVEAWVWLPGAISEERGIVGCCSLGDEGTQSHGWVLGVGDGQFGLGLVSRGASGRTIVPSRGDAYPERWQHLAAVYDGVEVRLYVDGQLRNGSDEPSGDVPYPDPARLLIGGDEFSGALQCFSGRIDDVRLWKRARSGAEIKRTMNCRLKGDEPDLVAYWRLDQSEGELAPDSTKDGHPAHRIRSRT
jgi:hypothetical protein